MVGLLAALLAVAMAAPAGAVTEAVTGTATSTGGNGLTSADFAYSSPGALGSGTIHSEFVLIPEPFGAQGPTTVYTVGGFATNAGWPDPWVAPDGTEFHFSPTLTLTGAELQDGTVFVVARPSG